jgi:hypothetical protein
MIERTAKCAAENICLARFPRDQLDGIRNRIGASLRRRINPGVAGEVVFDYFPD